jgi:hypothetical protein
MAFRVLRFASFITLAAACGGSTVYIEGNPDAAAPTAEAGGSETGATRDGGSSTIDAGARRDAATADADDCVDADLPNLTTPDAALGDAGSLGKCTACIKANCMPELQACQDECECRESVLGFLDCLAQKKTVQTCGGGLVTAGATSQALGLCTLNAGCSTACGN